MKRISFAIAALACCAACGLSGTAWAVNPAPNSKTPNSQGNVPQGNFFNPSTLPGQGYYGQLGNSADPYFNPNLPGTTPSYPGLWGTPGTLPQPVPNPNPGSYPDQGGRTRVTTPTQPEYKYAPPPTSTPAPASAGTPRKWRLGVYSKDTDTGVKIHDIVTGGAAARAGLEVNDLIVTVNGYGVGYINGQLYDCGTEFDRLADENGWVNLLVQNSRDGKLLNVPVQLDSRMSELKGSVALPNRNNLPANAIVNVELKETIGNNANPVTFASTQIDNIKQYPIPFKLEFDPAHISQNGRYLIYASVLVNGREIYRTSQLQRVLDQPGQPRPVALLLDQVPETNRYPGNSTGSTTLDQNAQIAQIVKWFNQYLGRDPSDKELVNWLEALRQGQSISQVQLALLANEQFFNRCDADKRVYITRMHELLVGREPTPDEMSYWVARYDAQGGIRRAVAQEFQGAIGIH